MQLVRKSTLASALVIVVLLVLLVLLPGSALASSGSSQRSSSSSYGLALPLVAPSSVTTPPPGFTSNADQAVKASELNRTMLALHARKHPLQFQALVWDGHSWFVNFAYRGKLVAEVVETPAARVTHVWTGPLASAVYARGDFATLFGSAWVLIPFSVLFLVLFVDVRRAWRMLHLDALVMLSFLASYLLFDHAKLVPAVWLVYPPLLYLMCRLLWIGGLRIPRRGAAITEAARVASTKPRRTAAGLPSWLSLPVLAGGLVLLVIARIVLSLVDATVIDVGYASVIGAHQIATGHSIYLQGAANGDTYGPVAYLAYLPFELIWPWHGAWNYLPSAHAASIFFDLVTVVGLVALGRRLRPGHEGWRLGLAFGWAWSACPFTLLALMMHSNDGLIAMLSVLSLLAFASPGARGALLGLAAAAKFAPAALIGLYAGDRRRGIRGMVTCIATFSLVVVVSIWAYLPSGGLHEFYEQTIGFQLHRTDVFSPWALYSSLELFKIVVEVGVVALCALLAFIPDKRTLVQTTALAGAITIAVQLPAVHWFYYYIVWFVPFVVVAFLAREDELQPAALDTPMHHAGHAGPAPDTDRVPAAV
jgi:hypothetical protein